jgi:hypothetical protein
VCGLSCGYLTADVAQELDHDYYKILGQLVRMISEADQW